MRLCATRVYFNHIPRHAKIFFSLALCGNTLEVAPRQSLGGVGATDGLARIDGDLAIGECGSAHVLVTGIATVQPGTGAGIVHTPLLVTANTKDNDFTQDIPCELIEGRSRDIGLVALAKRHVHGREVGAVNSTGLERLLGQIEFGRATAGDFLDGVLALQLSRVENEGASLHHAEKGGEDDSGERNKLDHG